MYEANPRIKPCVVILEQCTPKAQLALSAELRNVIHERNILTAKTRKKFLSDLDEITEVDAGSKRSERKNQVLQEILDSEVTYLKQLEIIRTYFIEPIKDRKILPSEDLEAIFGNIRSIYEVNGALLTELKKDFTNVAQAFLKLAPFFKLYSVYAYDYNKSINQLQALHINNQVFSKFLENQESRPEVRSKLSALLIAPIQRVPRYCLLLQQVLDNTSPSDDDFYILSSTLKKLQQAANHINKLVGERENAQRLLELQRSLQKSRPLIIKPGRNLIKEGCITKYILSAKHNVKLYFVLLSDILMCCEIMKPCIEATNSLKCILILPLNKCKVKYYARTKMIRINCEDEMLYVYHENCEESERWFLSLDETINKYVYDRQTLRKDSSLRRPAYGKTFNSYSDTGISPDKMRRKRKLENLESTSTFESIYKSSDGLDDSDEDQTCFAVRNLKRRPIKSEDSDYVKPAKQTKLDNLCVKDSLFPLRFHSGRQQNTTAGSSQNVGNASNCVAQKENAFVFYEEDAEVNASRIGNFFSTISKGFKRIFGYK